MMIDKLIKRTGRLRFLLILVSVFFIYFTFLTLSQHKGLKTQMNDLGNMIQPLHNTFQGRFMQTSNYIISEKPEINRFGIHANFIFFFLLPIYYLFPFPETLLILQILFISSAAFSLFFLSANILRDKKLAVVPPFLLLININVHDAALYDFHAIILFPFFLFAAFYFWESKNKVGFYLMLFFMIILKEDISLVTAMIGLFIAWEKKRVKEGILIFIVSVIYFAFTVGVLMPYFSEGYPLAIISDRYSHLGSSSGEILMNIIQDPIWFVSQFLDAKKITYILVLWLPFLYLPLLSWKILLLALPHLFMNLLSSSNMTYQPVFYYHTLPVVSVFILCATYSFKKLIKLRKTHLVSPVVVFSIAYSIVLSPAPYSLLHSYEDYSYDKHSLQLQEFKVFIPKNASLSVQNNLGAHFAQREFIYTFPFNKDKTDYVLLDLHDPFPDPKVYPRPFNFMYYSRIPMSVYKVEIEELFEHEEYFVTYYTEDGYLLFKRGDKDDVEGAREMFDRRIKKLLSRYADYEKYIQQN